MQRRRQHKRIISVHQQQDISPNNNNQDTSIMMDNSILQQNKEISLNTNQIITQTKYNKQSIEKKDQEQQQPKDQDEKLNNTNRTSRQQQQIKVNECSTLGVEDLDTYQPSIRPNNNSLNIPHLESQSNQNNIELSPSIIKVVHQSKTRRNGHSRSLLIPEDSTSQLNNNQSANSISPFQNSHNNIVF